MNWTEAQQAIADAQRTIRCADNYVGQMASIIAGRLRNSDVSVSTLNALKRELADWDMHRKEWKR